MGEGDPSLVSKRKGGGVFQSVLIVNTQHVEIDIYTSYNCVNIKSPH